MSDIKLNVNGDIPPLFVEPETKRHGLAAAAAVVVPAVLVVGLLFALISMQRGLETGVSNLARLLPIGFAVAAGMVATVNPCGVLMLPSYALYQVGSDQAAHEPGSTGRRTQWSLLPRALAISAAATGGFVTVFAAVGAAIAAGGQWLIAFFPYAGLAIGIGMIGLGIWLLATGKTLGVKNANRLTVKYKQTLGNAFVFGISYAAGSLSCTLPIFLVVVGGALGSDAPLAAVGQLVGYALGMGSVLVVTIVGTALFQQAISRWMNKLSAVMHRVSAMFLVGAGGYLLYYWIFIARVFGM